MRLTIKLIGAVFILICAVVFFISNDPYPGRFSGPKKKAVYIRYENGKYTFYRFGKPFYIKGAAGFSHLNELKAAGGNAIRIWDTVGLDKILADAERNDIAVIVGLPMPYNDNMDEFYNDDRKVQAQFDRYERIVRKYRHNKAILCWCLGNELTYPVRPKYFRFYKVFNHLVDMIHHEDPDHPVTTTLINFEKKYILNIKLWTRIDLISFNTFGALHEMRRGLADFRPLWKGPFLITEWGVDGPWPGSSHTAWKAYIEPVSDKKAERYRDLYQKHMPLTDPGFLGCFVFYWGYKQETTPTWFSLFDKEGKKSAAVNEMQYLWTGIRPLQQAPGINYMLVDKQVAEDNLLYIPGALINSQVYLKESPDMSNYRFKWFVKEEDWFRVKHFYNQKEKLSLYESAPQKNAGHFAFHAPRKEGPYRVYVVVYNDKGYFATANTPFYVVRSE